MVAGNSTFKISAALLITLAMAVKTFSQQTIVKYLSGTDKDHTVAWDFMCTTGRQSNRWLKIPVPSNWELQGFGTYNYFQDTTNPTEKGLYKYIFNVPPQWGSKRVFIVFEGAMTDTEVKINGAPAGPVHQGGFYRFKYDITALIKANAPNLLEVTVSKQSANESVNHAERHADFWQFGGIYRPVYLEVVPQTYIDRVAIDARADGLLNLDVYAANLKPGDVVTAQVQTLQGTPTGQTVMARVNADQEKVTLQQQFNNIKTWNPEFPNLYNLLIFIKDEKGIVHQVKQRFGFRTMELRPRDGIYVNGKRVIFKGVCRHSEWPESGRTMSKDLSLLDVGLMKEMNINAVRMSHYPPDQHFLDVCDSLGMFVLDELTSWQAKYDTLVGHKLVKELVVRDVNHPSIVIWDNGNEGGWNTALDGDYALYDPQKRTVIHPWEKFNGVDNKHYPDYNYVENSVLYGNEVFFPTEFMHGNYDGGSGAALDDYWTLMLQHPYFAGGFLWSFADEGVIRTDKDGEMDTANDSAPDGIVGPHREKEGSFFTIKELWSPVQVIDKIIPLQFNGRLRIQNTYIYTNLNQCSFSWQLVKFPAPADKTIAATVNTTGVAGMNLEPGATGFLDLKLPAQWQQNDALYLKATDPYGKELFTWSWAIRSPLTITGRHLIPSKNNPAIQISNSGDTLAVKVSNVTCRFDVKTGCIVNVVSGGKTISLSNGPVLAGAGLTLKLFKPVQQNGQYVVQCNYSGTQGWLNVKWLFSPGEPVKLEYQYSQKGDVDFMGITFDYPEDKVTGMKWLGQGPYRVWKNRLKGQQFGVWQKDYNNTITGQSWQYPEFKGYHAKLYWVVVQNKEQPFTVYTDDENMFLQMFKPEYSRFEHKSLQAPFPEGNIGFLNAIAPIGTRFQQPELLGPQSQKNMQLNYTPVSGSLWFDFR